MTAHAGGAALLCCDRSADIRCARAAGRASRLVALHERDECVATIRTHPATLATCCAPVGASPCTWPTTAKRTRPHIVRLARRNGCELYLPAIADYRHRRMEFRRYARDTRLRPNRYGIAEPERGAAARIAARHLDLVLVPLVAVDARGSRLGSGAGFYDRCLQHLRAGRRWRRPKLIGSPTSSSASHQLAARAWDVPLDALTHRSKQSLSQLKGSP